MVNMVLTSRSIRNKNNRIRVKIDNAQAFVGAADNSLTGLGTFASRSEKKGGLWQFCQVKVLILVCF